MTSVTTKIGEDVTRFSLSGIVYTVLGAIIGAFFGAAYAFERAERQSHLSHVTKRGL